MTTLKQQIEEWSFEDCNKQKVAHQKAMICERWTAPEEDCYEIGYETGALRMARWWAGRVWAVGKSAKGKEIELLISSRPGGKLAWNELLKAADEILGAIKPEDGEKND